MDNIIAFPSHKSHESHARIPLPRVDSLPAMTPFTAPERSAPAVTTLLQPREALEKSLDAHRAALLDLAHRRQQFDLQMRIEENTAQIRLEAAAYRAMLAGVPESDIYALGEDMAEALSSAMDTVAGA